MGSFTQPCVFLRLVKELGDHSTFFIPPRGLYFTTLSASWSGNLVPYCGPSEGNCDTGILYAYFPKSVCCIYVIPLEANLGGQGEGFLLRDAHQWQPFCFLSPPVFSHPFNNWSGFCFL